MSANIKGLIRGIYPVGRCSDPMYDFIDPYGEEEEQAVVTRMARDRLCNPVYAGSNPVSGSKKK